MCDEDYNVLDTISVDEFRTILLKDIYQIDIPDITFINLLGRFMRIYGKKNYDELQPLAIGGEKSADSIATLEKLFGVYSIVKDFKEERDRTKDNWDTYDAAEKQQYIHGASVIKSDKEFEENAERIAALKAEISHVEEQMDTEMVSGDSKMTDEAAEIKGQNTVLKRQRSRLISQQNVVKISKSGGYVPSGQNMKALAKFFPTVNMKHLEEIEHFRTAIQRILTEEVSEETFRLQTLIDAIERDIARLESGQRKLGAPVKLPIAFLRKHSEFAHTIEELEEQNRQYKQSSGLAAEAKAAQKEYDDVQDVQLRKVESAINEEMVRINDFIYDGENYAPRVDLKKGNSYRFYTPDDDGTGTNFKGMIVFDLSILRLTQVPAVAHDSLIFKNIADLPIDKIFQLYKQSEKQVFVVFDKKDAYEEGTRAVIDETTVIELKEHGGELFGWSWAKKRKKCRK